MAVRNILSSFSQSTSTRSWLARRVAAFSTAFRFALVDSASDL